MTNSLSETGCIQPRFSATTPKELLANIKGQSFSITDYSAILKGCATGIHPEVDRLRKDVNDFLDSMLPNPKLAQKLKKADLSIMGATWLPYATYDRLRTVTFLGLWSFVWDDQVDVGLLRNNFQMADEFRAKTLLYAKTSLGLAEGDNAPLLLSGGTDCIIEAFDVIGRKLRAAYSVAQRERFFNELIFFVQSTRDEQILANHKMIPSTEQYWRLRMGTSGYGLSCALIEYSWGIELPEEVTSNRSMLELVIATVSVIWITNDICSLRKELADDQFSLPSCLMIDRKLSMQEALDQCTSWVESALAQFRRATQQLKEEFRTEPVVLDAISKYVQGCEHNMTGNVQWCWSTVRYKMPEASGGEVMMTF